jgi:hypothetical protein
MREVTNLLVATGHWLVDDCYANEMSNEKRGSSIYSIVYFICLVNKISRKNGFALSHQNGMWNGSQIMDTSHGKKS